MSSTEVSTPSSIDAAVREAHRYGARRRDLYLGLWAVAEALFMTRDGPPPAERLQWTCDEALDFLQHAGSRANLLMRVSLMVVNWIAPLLAVRLPPFRMLSLNSRIKVLERLDRSFLSLTLLALRANLCIIYYEHPDTAREVGFDSRCLLEPRS